MVFPVKRLADLGFEIVATGGTAEVLRRIAVQLPDARTIFSTRDALKEVVRRADLLIGAVLLPGAAAPKLVTREMVKSMKPASVIVDIAIDQGGCCETSKSTSHSHPVYVEEGVTHFCVTNMPGAVARTSTFALNNATLPFASPSFATFTKTSSVSANPTVASSPPPNSTARP